MDNARHPDARPVKGDAEAFEKDPLDPAPLLRQIAPARKLLALGDVRPLYLAWLANYYDLEDENTLEPPVPAGLRSLPPPLQAMAVFYGLAPELVAAAAARSPAIAEPTDEDKTGMRTRNEVRLAWPLAEPTRTMAELHALAADSRA